MTERTEFYIFRHGETDWNRVGRMQGRSDIPLNSVGIAQAEALRRFFDTVPRGSLLSSPLGRAKETMRIALRLTDEEFANLKTDARFAESHLGHAEGFTTEELAKRFGSNVWQDWISLGPASWHSRFPGGESKAEVRDRAMAALEDLCKRDERSWFIASHGGLLRRLLHHFHPDVGEPIDVVNGSVFKFVFEDERWSVERFPVFVP